MTKLSKLLYFFDFDHFKQTGYPAIGLEYFAFDHGPLPRKLWAEMQGGTVPEDLKAKVTINNKSGELGRRETEFKPKAGAEVDLSIFTRREQEILKKLAFIYIDASGKTMSDISHEDRRPWEITRREKGDKAEIDYILAIDENSTISREEAEQNLRDHFAITKLFNIEPIK